MLDRRLGLVVGFLLAHGAWLAVPASAQDSDDDAGTPALEDSNVLVTADRRETNLQNTPIAITAFGPGTLQDRRVSSVRDLQRRPVALITHFTPLFHQLAREKPRRSTTMPAFFAGDPTKNRRKLRDQYNRSPL